MDLFLISFISHKIEAAWQSCNRSINCCLVVVAFSRKPFPTNVPLFTLHPSLFSRTLTSFSRQQFVASSLLSFHFTCPSFHIIYSRLWPRFVYSPPLPPPFHFLQPCLFVVLTCFIVVYLLLSVCLLAVLLSLAFC